MSLNCEGTAAELGAVFIDVAALLPELVPEGEVSTTALEAVDDEGPFIWSPAPVGLPRWERPAAPPLVALDPPPVRTDPRDWPSAGVRLL